MIQLIDQKNVKTLPTTDSLERSLWCSPLTTVDKKIFPIQTHKMSRVEATQSCEEVIWKTPHKLRHKSTILPQEILVWNLPIKKNSLKISITIREKKTQTSQQLPVNSPKFIIKESCWRNYNFPPTSSKRKLELPYIIIGRNVL